MTSRLISLHPCTVLAFSVTDVIDYRNKSVTCDFQYNLRKSGDKILEFLKMECGDTAGDHQLGTHTTSTITLQNVNELDILYTVVT